MGTYYFKSTAKIYMALTSLRVWSCLKILL